MKFPLLFFLGVDECHAHLISSPFVARGLGMLFFPFVGPSPDQVLWEDDFMAVIVKPQGVAVSALVENNVWLDG